MRVDTGKGTRYRKTNIIWHRQGAQETVGSPPFLPGLCPGSETTPKPYRPDWLGREAAGDELV